jgi:hypothetical protein
MSSQIIKEEIVRLLEAIEEQTLIIHAYEKNIPQIELDLIMENIRKLYSRFHELNKINSGDEPRIVIPSKSEVKEEAKTEAKAEVKNVEAVISEPAIAEEIPVPAKQAEEEMPAAPQPEQKSEIGSEITESTPEPPIPPAVEVAVAATPIAEKEQKRKSEPTDLFGTAPTVADKYKENKKYINDSMAGAQKDQSLGARLQKNKVTDLKAAIGINEKFLFINELFKGDMQKYLDAINLLNTQPGRVEAEAFLEQYVKQYGWKADSDAFVKFMSIFNRRF